MGLTLARPLYRLVVPAVHGTWDVSVQPGLSISTMTPPTAILSVYDKTGLIELAQGLAAKGVRLLGSGGTARAVREAGLEIGYAFF